MLGCDHDTAIECPQHPRIARHQRADRHTLSRKRDRQSARDIREATCLDQREDLGDDSENVERRHYPRRSSIGWVIRHIPLSVRRKRSASASGSSPTTSPSGIRTPRSIMTLLSRAPRPMSTYGITTLSSTRANECMCTPVNSKERRNIAPEMMQPPDTSELIAWPRRSSPSCTNLAGGVTSA